jgi:hypothetical protein
LFKKGEGSINDDLEHKALLEQEQRIGKANRKEKTDVPDPSIDLRKTVMKCILRGITSCAISSEKGVGAFDTAKDLPVRECFVSVDEATSEFVASDSEYLLTYVT